MSQLFPVSWSLPIPATILCSCAAPDMSHYQTLFSVQSFQDFKIVANFHKLCNIWFAVINTKEKLQWTWKHKITGPALTMCVLCISILLWTTTSTAARNLWLCFWCFLSHLYVSNQAWCGLPRCHQTTTIISRMDLAVVLMQWASIEQWSISDRIIIYIFICKLIILFQ